MGQVLVIGVRGGVGEAVARLLIEQGHKVIGTVRSAKQADEVRAKLPELTNIFPLDLTDAPAVKKTLITQLNNYTIDGVIVCAAISGFGPMETASLTDFKTFLEINTVSNLAIYQASIPLLRKTSGRLILISSHSGKVALPFLGLYQASKFALEGLADTLRQEAADFNVNVVLVQPGGIDTKMSKNMGEGVVKDIAALSPEQDARYGHLYRQFQGRVEGATNMSSAMDVAQTVVKAFNDQNPEPRYRVGEDTEFLLSQRQALTDRQLDALISSL